MYFPFNFKLFSKILYSSVWTPDPRSLYVSISHKYNSHKSSHRSSSHKYSYKSSSHIAF